MIVCILHFFCSVITKNDLHCFTLKETLRVYFLFKGLVMNSTNYEQRCLCKQVPWSHGTGLARDPGAGTVSQGVRNPQNPCPGGSVVAAVLGGADLGEMPGMLRLPSLWRFRPQVNN